MARSTWILLAAVAVAATVTADKSHHGSPVHYGYGYKPFSYGYGVREPYRQKTHVYHQQLGLGYGYPYGYGYNYGYNYGYPYNYGYGYGRPVYSQVYSGYPAASYAPYVGYSKVHPHKYADSHTYVYRPGQFGYSSTVVHPAGATVVRPIVEVGKPVLLHGKTIEKTSEAPGTAPLADEESASGDGIIAE